MVAPLFAERQQQEVVKEKDRTDHAEAELARLQAFLAEKGLTPPSQ